MTLAQLETALRLGAMSTVLLLAWLLFRRRREAGVPALLFAPMAICLAGFLAGNTPNASLRLSGGAGAIASLASGCTVVFLWWFCLACFDRGFRPRGPVLWGGILWVALAVADRVTEASLSPVSVALGFAIVGHLVWRLYAEREGDLIQRRYDARAMVALLLGGLLLVDLCVDLFLGFDWRPLPFAMAQNAAILGFGLWLGGQLLDVRPGVLSFAGGERPEPARLPLGSARGEGSGVELRRRLAELVEVERLHLDPDLGFATFVKRMNAPERAVRKLVNHELGFDHFRSFLNHYRLIEARRLLADPGRSSDKLIAIALDSGFASLPSFNRVFRDSEGCTPGQYRDRALAAGRAAENREISRKSSPVPEIEKR